MPTYDYRCQACGHGFLKFESILTPAEAKVKCPKCGKYAGQRKIGAGAGLIFKGKGFHCTDYKKGSDRGG
jgi:putative FmdB family regulatory protein